MDYIQYLSHHIRITSYSRDISIYMFFLMHLALCKNRLPPNLMVNHPSAWWKRPLLGTDMFRATKNWMFNFIRFISFICIHFGDPYWSFIFRNAAHPGALLALRCRALRKCRHWMSLAAGHWDCTRILGHGHGHNRTVVEQMCGYLLLIISNGWD